MKMHILLIFILSTFLLACNGDKSGNDNITNPNTDNASFTGRVASHNGYLSNMNVCLDINTDRICNKNEVSTLTDNEGYFTLNGLSEEDIKQGVIVAYNNSYRLMSPTSSNIVNVFTTLVQNQIDLGSIEAAAILNVEKNLGIDVDLNIMKNYIEEEPNYRKNHLSRISNAMMKILSHEDLKNWKNNKNSDDNFSLKQINAFIFIKLKEQLSYIKVRSASEDVNDDVINDIVRIIINEDMNNIESKVDLVSIIEGDGLHWVLSGPSRLRPLTNLYVNEKHEKYKGIIKQKANNITDTRGAYIGTACSFYDLYKNGKYNGLLLEPTKEILEKEGWVARDDTIVNIERLANNSIKLIKRHPSLNQYMSATQINIEANTKIRDVLTLSGGSWGHIVPDSLTLTSDSKVYKIEQNFVDGGYYLFNRGNILPNECIEGDATSTLLMEQKLGICNGVRKASAINREDGWLTSLSSTISKTENNWDNKYLSGEAAEDVILVAYSNEQKDSVVYAQLLPDGSVNFYLLDFSVPFGHSIKLKLFEDKGKWEDIYVHGNKLRKVTGTSAVLTGMDYWTLFNKENNTFFLIERDFKDEYGNSRNFVRVMWFVTEDIVKMPIAFDKDTQGIINSNIFYPSSHCPKNQS